MELLCHHGALSLLRGIVDRVSETIANYRVQDGCWNCIFCAGEVGPDGSEFLICLYSSRCSTSTMARGNIVLAAGICEQQQAKGRRENADLHTHEVW